MRLTAAASAIPKSLTFRKLRFKHPAGYYQERAGILLLSAALLTGGYLLLNQTKTTQITYKEDPPQVEPAPSPAPAAAAPAASVATGQIVSLNRGSAADLDSLPGVGPATAQKIIDYRTQHGPFKTIEGIMDVSGIGPAKYAKMKPFLKL